MKKLTLSTLALIVSASTMGFTAHVSAAQSEQSPVSEQSDNVEQKFQAYVDKLRSEALDQGYTKDTLDRAFAKVKYYQRAVELDKNQPEFKLTLDTYLPRVVPDWKAQKAVEKYQEHKDLLDEIGKKYGVQPRFIVALWGNETNFGSYTGGFD
ncbi:MAG: lytic transglycosylase, partial [Idiomarinaceae bacterium]|nr:lytic transglycosylase [Idiomarinaceae bacterium]